MSERLDFTKMRKGSKPDGLRGIAICPECGQKGIQTTYRNGSGDFVHRATVGILGGWVIGSGDHCYIKSEAKCTTKQK